MKKEKSCGCIVIDGDQVLLIKNNYGRWTLPKGHMEKGETEQETAIREVKEETNIDVNIISDKKYIISYSPKEGVMKNVVFFVAKPTSKSLKRSEKEITALEFFHFTEAKKLIAYPEIAEIFREFLVDYRDDLIKDE